MTHFSIRSALFVALLTLIGCNKPSENTGPGEAPATGRPVKVAVSEVKFTPSYFPTTNPSRNGPEDAVWGTDYRNYLKRSYDYSGSLAKNPKPDLKMKESTHSGKWVKPTQSEVTQHGSTIGVWVNDELGKTRVFIDNTRRVFRVTDVGIETGDSVGGTLSETPSPFYFWKPLAKWQGEWNATIKKGKLDRRILSTVESSGSNDGKPFVVIRIVTDSIDDKPGVYLSSLRRLWLMDGIGIVRDEMYGSGPESPNWWRPTKQLVFEEWKGEVAPLTYLPRGER